MQSASILSVRVNPNERAVLEAAAEEQRTTLSDFIRRASVEAAETALFHRNVVTIPASDWEAFEAWIGRPAEDNPGLAAISRRSRRGSLENAGRIPASTRRNRQSGCVRLRPRIAQRVVPPARLVQSDQQHLPCDGLPQQGTGRIIGYFTLSAAQIERAFLPKPQQRNRPDPVPAILLGQLAVDSEFQGQGHAVDLLLHAYRRTHVASQTIGCMALITHPLDDSVRGFYAKWGFLDLLFDPRRAMIVRIQDLARYFARKLNDFAWWPGPGDRGIARA